MKQSITQGYIPDNSTPVKFEPMIKTPNYTDNININQQKRYKESILSPEGTEKYQTGLTRTGETPEGMVNMYILFHYMVKNGID